MIIPFSPSIFFWKGTLVPHFKNHNMTLVSALKPAGSKRPWGVAYDFVFEGAELQRSVMTCPGSHRAGTRSLVQCFSNFMCLSNLRLNCHKLISPKSCFPPAMAVGVRWAYFSSIKWCSVVIQELVSLANRRTWLEGRFWVSTDWAPTAFLTSSKMMLMLLPVPGPHLSSKVAVFFLLMFFSLV